VFLAVMGRRALNAPTPTSTGTAKRIGKDLFRTMICEPRMDMSTYNPAGKRRSLDSLGGASDASVEVKDLSRRRDSVSPLFTASSERTAKEYRRRRACLICSARRSVGVGPVEGEEEESWGGGLVGALMISVAGIKGVSS
jgi:hypothetical protein